MSLKEKLNNPFVRQYVIEILFPILGYFFFGWSLTIIAVFYLLDQIASEVMFVRRAHWINQKGKDAVKRGLIPIAIFISLLFLTIEYLIGSNIWLEIYAMELDKMKLELITFSKEEAWIIFPIVVFMYYIKDSFTFYMPRRYLNYDLKRTIVFKTINLFFLVLLVLSGLFAWSLGEVNEIIVLFTFIAAKLCFDFSITRWTNKKSLKNQ